MMGEIAYTDAQFGRLLDGLKEAGVYDDSIIVFVSDHGDEFMEHNGIGHGHSVYEELIHIPLIMRGPQVVKGRYDGLFELIDLAPTLMDMLDIPMDYTAVGRSFVKPLKKNRAVKEFAFSEVHRTMGFNAGSWEVSVRTESKKLIYYPHERKYSFFDLSVDPAEKNPLDDEQEFVNSLKHTLQNVCVGGALFLLFLFVLFLPQFLLGPSR